MVSRWRWSNVSHLLSGCTQAQAHAQSSSWPNRPRPNRCSFFHKNKNRAATLTIVQGKQNTMDILIMTTIGCGLVSHFKFARLVSLYILYKPVPCGGGLAENWSTRPTTVTPVVKTFSIYVVRPSKLFNIKRKSLTAGTVGCPSGSCITPWIYSLERTVYLFVCDICENKSFWKKKRNCQ